MVLVGRKFGAALAAVVVACTVAAAAQRPISPVIAIEVNGQLLPPNPAPRIVGGRILVPVAKIYAALGIVVARTGNRLVMSAPGQRIVLQIGSARAMIGDVPVMMDGPATTIGGATYVPLRFVADSLGAQVTYRSRSNRVEVTSSLVGRNPALEQRGAGGAQIVGTVSAVDLNSAPESITVERAGSARTISITSDAQVSLQDVVSRTTVSASLADVHVGDAVSVFVRPDGRVASVIARYASRSGKIAAVSAAMFVLDSGFMVAPDKSTVVTLNAQPATLADLKVGDSVTVRLNPDSNEKRQIIASRSVEAAPQTAPGPVTIEALTVTGKTALRAGDAFDVSLRGTPGGRGTYDIGAFVLGLPLTETQPGLYTARYTVPAGVNFGQVQIFGHLAASGAEAPRAEAPGLLAISTAPPQIVEIAPSNGQTVNNSRPSIFATFRSPTNIGINPSSVSISINGLDVTPSATRTDGFITYSPSVALNDGPVQVVVRVSDRAGNGQSRAWSFTIRSH
jgi:uncharacterized Zn-binding protein involved in type VI secretion